MSTLSYIHGHFDGRTFVPDEPVDMPVNQRVLIVKDSLKVGETDTPGPDPAELSPEEFMKRLKKLARGMKEWKQLSMEETRRENLYKYDERN